MTKPRATAIILQDLFDYLGDDRWDLGELLADAAYGDRIVNDRTRELVTELFASVDHTDGDLEFDDIVAGIRHVGTPFAVATANDMRDAEPIID